jgi:uncharacterized protein involved in outer membrane biogenesis
MISLRQFFVARWRKILIWGISILAAFTLAGFFAVPPILKSVLTKQLTAALHRDVTIREVRFNPFVLSTTLRGLTIKEPQGSEAFASLQELYLNLEASSVFRWAIVVKELRLTRPFIRIVRRQDQTYSFSDLLQGREAPQTPPAKPLHFSINNIRIADGGADFLDETVGKKHTVRELNIGIPFLSNIPSRINTFVQPGVSAVVNGTRYTLRGETKPFAESLETSLDLNIADLDLPYYLAYLPQDLLNFKLPSGRLDAKLTIGFERPQKGEQTLTVKGDVGLRNVAVDDRKGDPVVRLPAFKVAITSAELFARKVHLATVSLQSPELTVRREKTGTINLESLLPTPSPPKAAAGQAAKPEGEGLVLDVDEISVAGAKVLVSDLAPRIPFKTTLDPIDLKVTKLSNRPNTSGTYSLTARTEAKEELALAGTFSLTPLLVEGTVDAKLVPLRKYAPYYTDGVLFDIESGMLDLSSQYRYARGAGEPEITASGAAVSVSALRLKRRDETGDFLRVPSLDIKEIVADLSKRLLTVGTLSTRKGTLRVIRLPNGELDLQKLTVLAAPPAAGSVTPAAAEPQPWVVRLNRLAVDQYAATLEDRSLSQPITLTADSVRLTGENLSTEKNATGKLSLALLLDRSAKISTAAAVGLDPLHAEGRVQVSGLVLNRYAPFYKDRILFDLQDGTLDLASSYRVAQAKDALDVKLAGLSTSIKALRLKTRDTNQEFLSIPSLAIRNTGVDLSQQDVTVGDLSTEGGAVLVSRSPQGELNLANLLPRAPTAPEPAGGSPGVAAVPGTPGKPARPWTVKAVAISVNRYRIQATDAVPREPVKLVVEDLNVKAENLSTAENAPAGKVSLALRLDKGTVSVEGAVSVAPVLADLQLAVKDLDIRPFQPYVADKVKVTVADGRISTSGRLELSIKEPAGLQAKYTGETTLGKFAAIQKDSAEDILKWESLVLHDLSVGYNPLFVHAKKVALADFFARVIVQPDGRLNLQEIVSPSAAADQPKPAQPPSPPSPTAKAEVIPPSTPGIAKDIQIEEITLQGGRLQFLDRTSKPNYSATMTEIGGRVSGLSSLETSVADVELRGKMNNSAPLEITGKINPLKQDLFVDLRARFTGMDLSPTSPYSGKYVGYVIEKGKLSFDLKYLIDKGKLSSENKIIIDQFTFGDKVDSPTATSLPVKLGVALLKDRNGEIHLDIPVTGSIDDPKFSIWGVVWQIIGNLITKAVTSPFALLGAAFGGGADLQYVEFDPGRAALSADSLKKIDALVAALSAKPSLKLEIAGYVDPEADREGLKQYLLQRKVKAQKLNEMLKRGAPAVPVDEVSVAPGEYERYLTLAYRAEKFPKPRNFIGMLKSLPVPEMEKLILTHIEAGDEELRQLAAQRANAVKEAILQSGKVEAERLFIVEPKSLTPEKKQGLKDSRVEFKIG